MNTMISGSGSDVLFLHGGGVSGWMWRPVVAQLAGTVRSIVPDLPGHGTSSSVEYTSHDDAVDRLVALIRDRAQNGVTVVGFSLGAQLALRLAADHPSLVRAALIISGETVPAPAQAATLALLRASAPLARREWFARLQAKQLGVPETLLERYIEDSRAMTTDTLVASVRENIGFTLPEGWRRFAGPAAVVVGARERGLMRKSADLTHEALPHSSLVVVPDAAHDAPLTRPDRIADEVRRLLAQAEAGRTGSDAS
ncbi:alpha/beta fold hydrolase [Leucobacter aridicollis]|uniref:alpha/beta fold hydrolase n=1 Tax=Leucobacter aridicollis TaxID=283878 RepID=UPI0021677A95|nr:alpha/beta hydrolase [Leucobacter aridicollis]MCS3428166.1 pimeloyl-ACP methyl ester carboxylesterase [Leucobacter aridicollis]